MTPFGDRFKPTSRDPLLGLSRQIGLTKLAIVTESALRSFWPLVSVALTIYGFVAFGGHLFLPAFAVRILLGLSGILLIWFLYTGFRRFRIPGKSVVLSRLDDGLLNSPIAALQDNLAKQSNDPLTKAIWLEHQERMLQEAGKARAAFPDPDLVHHDTFGLRLLALIIAIAALSFAPRPNVESIVAAVTGNKTTTIAPSFAVEAWATPPAYTGKPALYLTAIKQDAELNIPIGSEITVRFYGAGTFSLIEGVSGQETVLPEQTAEVPVQDVLFKAQQSGQITLQNGNDILGQWNVSIVADLPPTLRLPNGTEKSPSGAMELVYAARDDYGIETAKIVITPDLSLVKRHFGLMAEPVVPEPVIRDLPMPFSQDRTDIKETFVEDFSADMWAHLPVIVTVEVTDALGQKASVTLEPAGLVARSFFDPLAAALIEQRRDLLWSPENDTRVSQVLRAMTYKPEQGLFPSSSTYLMTRAAIRRMGYQMENGFDATERAEITEMLWLVANRIENGDLSGAEARLRRAQERVAQALENGATQGEMAELMDELRAATEEYLRELAQNAEPGDGPTPGQQAQSITTDQLQQMLDKIQELFENGQREEARQLLEELRQFMENMQMTQQQSQPGQGGQSQQNLQDSLEQQQQLSDEAFQRLQEELGQGQEQSGQGLAERQEALRQFLEDLQQQGDSEAIDEAEQNMGQARDRLREGDFSGALDEQADVMENLRQGLRDLQNQNQANQSSTDGQDDPNSMQRDPLGRPIGSQGRVDNGDTAVPDQNAADRARELMEEIRRRSGDAQRPEEELEYLRRLLERF